MVCAHPSWITEGDIDGYGDVPVQFLAPEVDEQFPVELKMYAFKRLVRFGPFDCSLREVSC